MGRFYVYSVYFFFFDLIVCVIVVLKDDKYIIKMKENFYEV